MSEHDQAIADEAQRKLVKELRGLSTENERLYGFYEHSLLVMVEDLKPICDRLGITVLGNPKKRG